MADVDLAIAADETTLPALIEAVKRLICRRPHACSGARRETSGGKPGCKEAHARSAAYAWDASQCGTRVAAELWEQIKNEDWSLVSNYYSEAGFGRAALGLQQIVSMARARGSGGIGYGAPSSVGAALANKVRPVLREPADGRRVMPCQASSGPRHTTAFRAERRSTTGLSPGDHARATVYNQRNRRIENRTKDHAQRLY
jgi:thiamine pyrophosphate-dependent acetolactate synthase large subunit-like protein